MTKDVLIINQRGNNETELTDITCNTVREFYRILDQNGITYSGKTLAIAETSQTLHHPDMLLPKHDFTVFIYPIKNSGGITSVS
jgi:hypothetical protein